MCLNLFKRPIHMPPPSIKELSQFTEFIHTRTNTDSPSREGMFSKSPTLALSGSSLISLLDSW